MILTQGDYIHVSEKEMNVPKGSWNNEWKILSVKLVPFKFLGINLGNTIQIRISSTGTFLTINGIVTFEAIISSKNITWYRKADQTRYIPFHSK